MLLPLLILTGCEDAPTDSDGNLMGSRFAPNFSTVCQHYGIQYLRDVDTNIMYVYWDSGTGGKKAAMSVYYNSEGQPMTYSEFKEVHTAKYH